MPRVIAMLVLLCGTASAERVIVADSDPALREAIVKSLRPWKIEVVVDAEAPTDAADTAARGNARYVVWRDGTDLVVFDRDTNLFERRPAHAGALDPLGAAAAALSVKTMLRLPPEPTIETPRVEPADDGIELRLEAGAGSRFEYGLDGNIALRFLAGVAVRPWRDQGFRFGIRGDFGASATVEQSGFHGTWSNWGVLGTASWAYDGGVWEVGPWVGLGFEYSSLDGIEMGTTRNETATLLAIRGGAQATYHAAKMWNVGGLLTVEGLAATRTYTKLGSGAQVFEIPPIGVVLSVVVGADLTP
jgi:hypothetical protein